MIAALVECGHRFIRGACLNLHKIGTFVGTRRTLCVRGVNVLPGSNATQNVINFLEEWIGFCGYLTSYFGYIRASVARESVA